jgi:hypothetical protein
MAAVTSEAVEHECAILHLAIAHQSNKLTLAQFPTGGTTRVPSHWVGMQVDPLRAGMTKMSIVDGTKFAHDWCFAMLRIGSLCK